MCICGKPTINGQPGYRWNNPNESGVHPINAPTLKDSDVLVFDEPGRCGGLDSHSHHFTVVKEYGTYYLLTRHGGGEERANLHAYGNKTGMIDTLAALDSNARYWLLHALYQTGADGKREGRERESQKWTLAAAEGRIKRRKVRGVPAKYEVRLLPPAVTR